MNKACNFQLDIVVTRLELSNQKFQNPAKLSVDGNAVGKPLEITSSRINVTEFKYGTGLKISEKPKALRKLFEDQGITLRVKYGNLPLAVGKISFPSKFAERIEPGMTDLLHAGSCELFKNEKSVGTIVLLCRLIVNCDEPTELDKSCQNVDKSINPQDILFIMGERQRCPNPCEVCPDVLDADEDDELLKLDLERYHRFDPATRHPENMVIEYPAGNVVCGGLKQMTREVGELLDSVTQRAGQFMPCLGPAETCKDAPEYQQQMEEIPTWSLNDYPNFAYKRNSVSTLAERQQLVPISKAQSEPQVKSCRFCPVCLSSMSWLPKFAACPKCGIKPTPVVKQCYQDKKLTADQILIDYLGKVTENPEDFCRSPCEDKTNPKECRCNCALGKKCAHCRIRELCSDIFQADEQEKSECPKEQIESCEGDVCAVLAEGEDCRPYLSRVFSELIELYNVQQQKILEEQQNSCQNMKKSEKFSREANVKIVDSAKFKEFQRNHPTVRMGHKHCLSKRTYVPRHHGWNWHSSPQHLKHGWRPGYTLKSINRLMHFFLHYLPNQQKAPKRQNNTADNDELPILNVCKKNGDIFIKLRATPGMQPKMKPITFKIVKSPKAVALSEIKQRLKAQGFAKCSCNKSLMLCVCRDPCEKLQLNEALQKECQRRGLETCANELILTDTTDSELEFDFDINAAQGRTKNRGKRPNQKTQTSKLDYTIASKYPAKPINPYWRSYDCAAGDRYRGTAFGDPGEAVYEDGVFGLRGGGPHGAPTAVGGRQRNPAIWNRGNMAAKHVPIQFHGKGGTGGKAGTGSGSSKAIPVRLPKRLIEAAAKAKREAEEKMRIKKKPVDMMKYLKQNQKLEKIKGPDGLTNSQRRRRELRRALHQVPPPGIDAVTQLDKWCKPYMPPCLGQFSTEIY